MVFAMLSKFMVMLLQGLHVSVASCNDGKCPASCNDGKCPASTHGVSFLQAPISEKANQKGIPQGHWTHWSNSIQKGRLLEGKCGPGSWITEIQFSEQGGYGLIDVRFRCAGSSSWNRLTNNNDGKWNPVMGHQQGINQMTMTLQDGYGLINAYIESRWFRDGFGGWIGDDWRSNDNIYGHAGIRLGGKGERDPIMECDIGNNLDWITGLQVREEPGYGLVNLRPFCQLIKCRVRLYEHDDFSGWKWERSGWEVVLPPGVYNHDSMISAGATNDALSALIVEGDACCKATVYEHGDFTGWSKTFGTGRYTHPKFVAAGAKNDDVSAIKVGCE